MSEAANAEHKWSSDRPKERIEEDELGRSAFANQIAKELNAWRQKDSLVVGLSGEWGVGKTTLVNFILSCLKKQTNQPPTIVRFNPWQWSGQDKLLEGFFFVVGAGFREDELGIDAAKLSRFWEGLRVVTVAGGELASGMQQSLVTIIALLTGGTGLLSTMFAESGYSRAISGVATFLMFLAALCAAYAPLAEKLATFFKFRAEKKPSSLDEIRANLKTELAHLKNPVLVVIDDIDRLSKQEIRLLVQLVKANADFPNVIYLLLYQQDIISAALGDRGLQEGRDYLKKIVQVELRVPAASDTRMRSFFRSQIEPILSRAQVRWENDRWGDVFEEGIWPYFRTPRDIVRFRAVLDFYHDAHVNSGVLEVNPIDLIILETLRVFDPEAYDAISRAFQQQKDILLAGLFFDKETKTRINLGITFLLKRDHLSEPERDRLSTLLYQLFPQARDTYSHSERSELDWKRNLRIRDPQFFQRYFQVAESPTDISASFISQLIGSEIDRQEKGLRLREAIKDKPFTTLIERLHAVAPDIHRSALESLVGALLDISDQLPATSRGVFSLEPSHQIVRLIPRLLKQIEDTADRGALLLRTMETTSAITVPVLLVGFLWPSKPTKEDEALRRVPDVPVSDLEKMKSLLLPRLWKLAKSGAIWAMQSAGTLFYVLARWADPEELKQWMLLVAKDARSTMSFLRATLRESQATGHRGTRTIYTLEAKSLEKWIDLELLASSAVAATPSDELEKATVETLRTAITMKNEKKPFDALYVISRDEAGSWSFDRSDVI